MFLIDHMLLKYFLYIYKLFKNKFNFKIAIYYDF